MEVELSRPDVFGVLNAERDYQDEKWGTLDQHNSIGDFMMYMRQRMLKAEIAYGGLGNSEQALAYIKQVAAIGVACMEKFGPGLPRQDHAAT